MSTARPGGAVKAGRRAARDPGRAQGGSQRPGQGPRRRLGWLLAGPAFVVMLAVTLYPILQAIYDSLFRYRLTAPDDERWAGLQQLRGRAHRPGLLAGDVGHRVHHGRHGGRRAGPRLRAGPRHAPGDHVAARPAAHRDPGAVRDHHGGLGVRLVLRLRHQLGLHQHLVRLVAGHQRGHQLVRGPGHVACSSSSARRSGRRRRSSRCCCSPACAQVPTELEEAAEVDGATWAQRLARVVLPNMKAAIMVAVLFRTLDAFRIFDNVFIMTNGANDTDGALAARVPDVDRPPRDRPRLGRLRAAVPVRDPHLLHRGEAASRSIWPARGGELMKRHVDAGPRWAWAAHHDRRPGLRAVPGALDHVAVVQAAEPAEPRHVLPEGLDLEQLRRRSSPTAARAQELFLPALRNSIGISLIATAIAVVLATLCAYAIARLDFPGKRLILLDRARRRRSSRRSRSSRRCSTCGARSGSTTPGSA